MYTREQVEEALQWIVQSRKNFRAIDWEGNAPRVNRRNRLQELFANLKTKERKYANHPEVVDLLQSYISEVEGLLNKEI